MTHSSYQNITEAEDGQADTPKKCSEMWTYAILGPFLLTAIHLF